MCPEVSPVLGGSAVRELDELVNPDTGTLNWNLITGGPATGPQHPSSPRIVLPRKDGTRQGSRLQ